MVYDIVKREDEINQIISFFHRGKSDQMILRYLVKNGWKRPDAMRLVKAAKDVLLLRLKRAKDEFKAESLAFYEGVCSNPEASFTERIKARERIDRLLGLEAQHEVHVEHDVKHVVDIDKLELDLDTAKKLLQAVRDVKDESRSGRSSFNGPVIDVEELQAE